MTSGGAEDGQKGPASVAAEKSPNNNAAVDFEQGQSPYAGDADSQLSDSLPRPRKSSSHDREIATALQAKGEQPLPYDDEAPPLPDEAPPEDDGWTYEWDYNAQRHYFYNRLTGKAQWENPRLPQATAPDYGSYDRYVNSSTVAPATSSGAPGTSSPPKRKHGGYNPAIHGDYDPNADYAREAEQEEEQAQAAAVSAAAAAAGLPDPNAGDYSTTAQFNRFTGRFQQAGMNPDYHNDENKSKRQMSAFFDVDAAANSHDGRSLKAERRGKSLSKQELKAFKEKRRDKKEEKRRAWLRD
ncbi:uncharacterized protein N0V89_010665 [Didymosphaeria variabile]|uniref:WW domain-containing protein n=1 Tax=Didymosphaeria variabile TaxID=1932322 RepID=A0A9W9C6S8_9PLEO|nr:uncharacterized protein N0V89_010665 [Didymosphaeria variabile]KAJ4346733.1 hypothetical protein N0V89_010665 [Didymosphaeria variabile]